MLQRLFTSSIFVLSLQRVNSLHLRSFSSISRISSRPLYCADITTDQPVTILRPPIKTMPPKKKISEEVTTIDGADSAASPAKKVRKSKKTTAGAGAADEEENSDSAKAEKAIKAPKAKVVQADYMPKTYAPEDYASAPEGALKIVSYNVRDIRGLICSCLEYGYSSVLL